MSAIGHRENESKSSSSSSSTFTRSFCFDFSLRPRRPATVLFQDEDEDASAGLKSAENKATLLSTDDPQPAFRRTRGEKPLLASRATTRSDPLLPGRIRS